jgi:tripartite-type tricarboxylate transporter receptor subunit TctC
MHGSAVRIVRMMTVAATLWFATASALAQSWPTRPITLVVPFAAGGTSDVIARLVAEGLRAQLGQPVLVENLGGAGGMLGASRVAKSPPDGYQIVLGNVGTHAQNQSLYKRPLYNVVTDFTPVALVTDQSLVLVVRKDFPAGNLREFTAYAKANQARLQYGSAGAGSSNHLACALLNSALGVDITHVPYRSGAQAMQDMLAGRIDYQCPSAPTAIPQMEAGTVKALAILSRNRSASMPTLPSAHEQGLTDFDIPTWYALFLPAGTPVSIVQQVNRAAVATLAMPLVQQRLKDIGSDLVAPERMTPDHLATFVATEVEKWARVIKASGITLE